MNLLFWMHSGSLCPLPDTLVADAAFVFDDEQLRQAGWGLKRIMFIYECLLELPVEIYRGPTVETLLALAGEQSAGIMTVDSPDPWLREQIRKLQEHARVEVLPAPPFVELRKSVDLRRFSRYWKHAGPLLV
jgi:deoxyribodipyrimidine photo-lyase